MYVSERRGACWLCRRVGYGAVVAHTQMSRDPLAALQVHDAVFVRAASACSKGARVACRHASTSALTECSRLGGCVSARAHSLVLRVHPPPRLHVYAQAPTALEGAPVIKAMQLLSDGRVCGRSRPPAL
jgi:hypothetical protein